MKLSVRPPSENDPIQTLIDNLDPNIPRVEPPTATKLINSGTFGRTYLHVDVENNKKYAVKTISLFKPNLNIKELIHNEVENYYNISNKCPKYFCQFIGYKYERSQLTIVMNYCGMDLLDYYIELHNSSLAASVKNNKLKTIFKQLAEALQCLHQNGYIHFDLKPENVTVQNIFDKLSVKLIDAGSLTRLSDYDTVRIHGTVEYMAPELKHGLLPKHINTIREILPTVYNKMVPGNITNNDLEKTDIYSYGVMVQKLFPQLFNRDFLQELIHPYPFRRPTIEQILERLQKGRGNGSSSRGGTRKNLKA